MHDEKQIEVGVVNGAIRCIFSKMEVLNNIFASVFDTVKKE